MFERYTEKARRTIFFARYEACRLGGAAIGPEHLLLGLLREDGVLLPRLLGGGHDAAKAAIRQRVEGRGHAGGRAPASAELPLSGECKSVLARAAEESEGMGHRHIGTEHLLLGLLREGGSLAAGVLREQGVGYDRAREALRGAYGE